MNNRPRISQFWLQGGILTVPAWYRTPPADDPPLRYQYGVEHTEAGPVVHRFVWGSDERGAWLAEDMTGRREAVNNNHRLVKAAHRVGQWNDEEAV